MEREGGGPLARRAIVRTVGPLARGAMVRTVGLLARNGGGAPVVVGGWTCQGYPTPEVLSTGDASQCHSGGAAIVAMLPVPAPSATVTTG